MAQQAAGERRLPCQRTGRTGQSNALSGAVLSAGGAGGT